MLQEPLPKTRLEIHGCETQGSEDMVLTLYNDREVARRSTQLTTWLILSTALENDDIATLIVACIRALFNQEPSLVPFEPLVFDETVKQVVDIANMGCRINGGMRCNGDKMIAQLEQIKWFFVGIVKNETTQKVIINIHDWYPTNIEELYGWSQLSRDRKSEAIVSMMAILLWSLLLHIPSIDLSVHSHNQTALFTACRRLLPYPKDRHVTKSLLDYTFWLSVNDGRTTQSVDEHAAWVNESSSLKIEKCIYCVRHAMEEEREKNNLLLLEATLEEKHSSWCTSQ